MTDTVNVPREDCPFCGSATEVRAWNSDGWTAYKCCDGCDMRGPASAFKYDDVEEAKTDAVARWNRAALAAAPKAEPVEADDFGDALLAFLFRHGLKVALDVSEIESLRQSAIRTQREAPKVEQEPELKADFTRAHPSGMDDVTYSEIEDALDRKDAPIFGKLGLPLSLAQRVDALYHPAPASDELLEALEGIVHFSDGFAEYGKQTTLGRALAQWVNEARSLIYKHKGPQS